MEPLNGSCRGLTLPVVSIRLAAESTVAVPYGVRAKVNCTADAAAILRPYFGDKATEEFVVMLLSSAGHVTAIGRAAMGGLSGVSVEPRTVFQFALLGNAASIIVAHNHPSGNPEPSETDVALTSQLIAAGKMMGIPVLDHVIVAGSAHSSVMQGAADATAPFPAALGTLPGTTPEPVPAETQNPALAANEPRAAYTPKIPQSRKEAALAPFGLAAIDEIMKPFHGPEAEVLRCAARITYSLNMREEPDDDVVALLTVLYCTPGYGAMRILPYEVRQHLRQAMKPGNSAALSDGPSVNEPRSSYTPEPVTAPIRGAVVARTTHAHGLTTTVYFTTRLVWVVGDDGELRRTLQLNFEAVTEAVSDSTSANEPRHNYRGRLTIS